MIIEPTTPSSWGVSEFGHVKLGDKRLTKRLVKLADSFTSFPESSINQACGNWSDTKAAYRFFQNDNINEGEILASHISKTQKRIKSHEVILAIQDTSYISYTSHKKTTGLGILSRKVISSVKALESKGLIMHTSFAVSTEGLPLGLLDQKIHARQNASEEIKDAKKRSHNTAIHIEDKESIKWLETLNNTNNVAMNGTQIVTVCDREADIYDFFELAQQLNSAVLVRASQDRIINKKSRYSTNNTQKLWSFARTCPGAGTLTLTVQTRDHKQKRTAHLDIKVGRFVMNPSQNNIRHKTEKLPNLTLYAIYVLEKNPPTKTSPLEWMLLTNFSVNNFDEAVEKVRWYCLRWRIEVFHKVLKSGFKVEECRLGTAERLIRYLTVMSIIAWRMFFITLMARTNPDLPCTKLLDVEEWKVLYVKTHKSEPPLNIVPPIKDAILWIAKLGGYLARKHDLAPGPTVLWRGWKRLFDLAEGWKIATEIQQLPK